MSTAPDTAEKTPLTKTIIFTLVTAITTILASAVVVMWAIIADPPGDTVGKAFITIFLIAGFTFILIAEVKADHLARYVAPGRIAALTLIAVSGLYLTWNQIFPEPWRDLIEGDFGAWFGVIFLLEGVVATLILLWPRMVKTMSNALVRIVFDFGVGLTILVSLLIAFAWTTWDLEWSETFWRIVLALTVLAVVVFLLPLVISVILAPKKPKPVYVQPQYLQGAPGYPPQAQQSQQQYQSPAEQSPPPPA